MAHPLAKITNFTYAALNKELELTATEKNNVDVLLQAYLDDFWQKGQGNLLPPVTGGRTQEISNLLEKRFVFRNVIKEVTGRVAGAFFGKYPNWKFQINGQEIEDAGPAPAPAPEDGATPPAPAPDNADATSELDEIDKALGEFFTKQNVANELSKAFEFRLAFGRGGWRLFVPTKFKRKNAVAAPGDAGAKTPAIAGDNAPDSSDYVQFDTIADAIRAMRIEFIAPTEGRLLDDGGELFSLVRYQVRRDWNTKDAENVIEFSFVDNSDRTFVGTVGEKTGGSTLEAANLSDPLPLAGLTTYGEFKGLPYVTKGLYKNNQLLNLALTCAGFSLVDNGFGEMILTNVELETERVMGDDGEYHEVPKRIKRGGGAVQNFVGIETFDEQTGAVKRESPGVTFKEPTSIAAFKDGAELAYTACLQEACQLYALISGDATASGESRIQALSDFIVKISPLKPEVDEQGGNLLTAVLLFAAILSGKSLEGHSVVYDSRMHVASLTTEEKSVVMTMREKGVISRATERVLLGIDDPGLEGELILTEQNATPNEITLDEFSEKLDVGLKMLSLGFDAVTIQKYLGFTDAEIKKMQDRQAEEEAALAERIRLQEEGAGGGSGATGAAA